MRHLTWLSSSALIGSLQQTSKRRRSGRTWWLPTNRSGPLALARQPPRKRLRLFTAASESGYLTTLMLTLQLLYESSTEVSQVIRWSKSVLVLVSIYLAPLSNDEVSSELMALSNCEWRTCSRSLLHSKFISGWWGSNPWPPHYKTREV